MGNSKQKNTGKLWNKGIWLIIMLAVIIIIAIIFVFAIFNGKDTSGLSPVVSNKPLTEDDRANIVKQLSATTVLKDSERAQIQKKSAATTQLSDAERQKIINSLSN